MIVWVTQFLLPDGKQRQCQVHISDDLQSQCNLLARCKCRLTAEMLTTGEVSQCIEHEEGDYAIEICTKSEVVVVLEKMIRAFDKTNFGQWLADFEVSHD